ncbi:MAG: Ppx/GppA family phosphatase, partial [Clostridia bacterium]|nr:Ppx/GppA family phosphatase [Clostridia bacterium]
DRTKTHGFILKREELESLSLKLCSMTVEEKKKLKGLQPDRADVIAGGAVLLVKIMDKIGINSVIVSEDDNLEGYLLQKTGK